MTVKALKRQLMAAIAMIMVSLIALSSSTYAWFTMNKTVTASGLTVKARTEGGIQIKRKEGSEIAKDIYEYTAPLTATMNLFPTNKGPKFTGTQAEGNIWVHATAEKASSSKADANTYAILNITDQEPDASNLGYGMVGTPTDGNFYYVYDIYEIQKDQYSKSFTDLFVSQCTVKRKDGGDISPISKALRVAVVCGDNVFIYAPVADASPSYDVITSVTTSGTTVSTTKEGITSYTTTTPNNATTRIYKNTSNSATRPMTIDDGALYQGTYTGTSGVEVTVYLYFEGEDGSLMANNIQNGLDELELTIKFTCSDVTPN